MPSLNPKRGGKRRLTRRNIKKAYPANRKERGEWVELLFMAEAARLGLKVLRPHGESARFDVVVEDGGGKLHRVQVKSTTAARKGAYECHCSWKSTTPVLPAACDNNTAGLDRRLRARQYSKQHIDFVAA